jgi:cytochrome c peroxidase
MLDFESSVFPAVSVRSADGAAVDVLSVDSRLPGIDGALADVVSGPRAVAFTPDGGLALVVDMASEDVLLVDGQQRVELDLVRPLPGHLPEGLVITPDGLTAFVDERASGDVAVLAIAADWRTRTGGRVRVDGAPIPRLATADPMPPQMRLGQRLFYSANSAEFPMTKNFWMSCASCHLEGRSDGVTWLFDVGPRDTPSNAGGTQGTGFLLHTAGRSSVDQYDETIRVEQGGSVDLTHPADRQLLDALSAYVDGAIPLPRSPERDPVTQAPSAAAQRGQQVFQQLGCPQCHMGPRMTDSGNGNPMLDLSGKTAPVLLHDVGTCATAPYADRPSLAYDGSPRAACAFDTPGLLGVHDSAPYLHDGSAATLGDVVDHFVAYLKATPPSAADRADLIAYLRSL